MSESIYLYTDQNKKIYEDVLGQIAKTNCRHTSMVLASKEAGIEKSGFIKSHLIECLECQMALRNWERSNIKLKAEIPYIRMPSQYRRSLNKECYMIAKNAAQFDKIDNIKKRMALLSHSKLVIRDLSRTLFTATMLKGMLLTVMTALFIHYLI